MQFAEQAQNNFFVRGVEVAGGLVGEHDFRIIDEGAGDTHPLLLASGKLRGQVFGAVFEAYAVERFEGFLFVGHAVEILGKHDVLDGGEIRDHVELLKDEADGLGAYVVEVRCAEIGDVSSVKPDFTAGGAVEAADEIDQGALAGARGTHHGDPLAGRDGERDVVERINQSVPAIIFFRSGGITLGDVLESNHLEPFFYDFRSSSPQKGRLLSTDFGIAKAIP